MYRIKRYEKKSPSWTYVVVITFLRLSLRTSSSIILCSSCDHLYSNDTLVRMSPVNLGFKPCCLIFKMNESGVMFVQARKLFLKLRPCNLSALMYSSEISMLKFTYFNNPFSCFAVDMSWFIVCCNWCFPYNVAPFWVFRELDQFFHRYDKNCSLCLLFSLFFISALMRFIAGSSNYCSEESDCENYLKCLGKLEHTCSLRVLFISV